MDLDLETFLTAVYVIVDDVYQTHIRPQMPVCGGPSALMSDSEVLCLGLNQSTRDSYTRCPGRTDITRLCVLPVYQCCVA